jgi:hypothetical protein
LLVTAVLVLAIALCSQRKRLRAWRKRHEAVALRQRTVKPVVRVYQAALARLAAAGLPREPWETPHEYLARLQASPLAGATVFSELTSAYASARYGDEEIPFETVARLRRESEGIGLPQ